MSAPVVYMESARLAGCDIWLKDGTHVIFIEGGEGNQPAGQRAPVPTAPRRAGKKTAVQEAYERAGAGQ